MVRRRLDQMTKLDVSRQFRNLGGDAPGFLAREQIGGGGRPRLVLRNRRAWPFVSFTIKRLSSIRGRESDSGAE